MSQQTLVAFFERYVACLNKRDFDDLGDFVADRVVHNGRPFGLAGYREMLEQDVASIPDLRFELGQIVADDTTIAARFLFDCHPVGRFLDLPVDGMRVRFAENVFYTVAADRIVEVWSVLDKSAIEQALDAEG